MRHRLYFPAMLSCIAVTNASPTIVSLPVFISLYLSLSGLQQQMQKRLYFSISSIPTIIRTSTVAYRSLQNSYVVETGTGIYEGGKGTLVQWYHVLQNINISNSNMGHLATSVASFNVTSIPVELSVWAVCRAYAQSTYECTPVTRRRVVLYM